jgi:hypothetical protein
MMRRRTFIASTVSVLLAPLAACPGEAQPAGKKWRIGYLSEGSDPGEG